jgi:heme-degrading monooxygenase HmoA
MFNVIFEVHPHPKAFEQYLALAQHLKPRLTATDGFIDNERFSSLQRPGWVLSLSTWRDEKSLVRWRADREHHRVQGLGRAQVFQDYRLQIGEVFTDSAAGAGERPDQQRFDETESGAAKAVTLTEMRGAAPTATELMRSAFDTPAAHEALLGIELYESIYTPGKLCALSSWRTAASAKQWIPSSGLDVEVLRHRCVRVVRAYGMRDRREAPQYHGDQGVA